MSRRRIRRHDESGALRTARAVVVLLTLVATIVTVGAGPAFAYWSSTGSTAGSASTGTLSAPVTVTVPATAAPNVVVSWIAGIGGVAPAGYLVTRYAGTTPTAACGSSPATPITDTTCSDTAVPDGAFTYTVTAVFASWTAQSLPSSSVVVENATQLVFLAEPTNTLATSTIMPAVTVSVRTADGDAFTSAGISITLAIDSNPGAGVLGGTTTTSTDADGVATFTGLSVNQPGVGYTLRATSPGLTPDISATFAVLPRFLGAAHSFSILGSPSVTNTGVSAVSGDVGVSPGSVVTGFADGTVGGDIHLNDAAAIAGQSALLTAYDNLEDLQGDELLVGEIGGRTFLPGVYHVVAALALTGTVTLNAAGDPNALFIFQTDAAFDTAAGSNVLLTGGAQAANIYWVVADAAGTGANAHHLGNILAGGAITLGAGTVLIGRALSRAAVTLGASTIRFTEDAPPTISITGGAAATTKDTTPEIAGTSNAAASSPITVGVGGQTHFTTVGIGGAWSVTAAALIAGSYEVVARVRDPAGNGTATTQQLTVEVNPAPVTLGTAGSYAVLATSVTNSDATVLNGDLGVSPGAVVTGFPPGVVSGATHLGDPTAAAARADLSTAYTEVLSRTSHTEIVGNLGGRTFHHGVHHSTAALALTGTVNLDAEGDPNAIFIFQTGAAFDTAAAARVVLTGGALAANVYWVVTGAAGTGANTTMVGTILAAGAITLGAKTTLAGRALSLDAVTMAANTIDRPGFVPAGIQGFVLESPADSDLSSGMEEVVPTLVSEPEAAPTQETTSPLQTSSTASTTMSTPTTTTTPDSAPTAVTRP